MRFHFDEIKGIAQITRVYVLSNCNCSSSQQSESDVPDV